MSRFIDSVLYIVSLLFRLKCKRFGKHSRIGPGYSIIGCHLENVVVGNKVQIGSNAWIQTVPLVGHPKPVVIIEDNVSIGRNATISAAMQISIGKDCLFSYGVSLLDHNHAFEDVTLSPLLQGIDEPAEVVVGEDCFIGAHSFILKGVVLGKHCVVGANSVVASSFPPFSVIAGSPARRIRSLDG